MTGFPKSPKLIKGGIVLLDPETVQVKDVISLQYNPETMSRSFQIQGAEGSEGGDRSQALRLKGPPVESYKLDAELDATDLLEKADKEATNAGGGNGTQVEFFEIINFNFIKLFKLLELGLSSGSMPCFSSIFIYILFYTFYMPFLIYLSLPL